MPKRVIGRGIGHVGSAVVSGMLRDTEICLRVVGPDEHPEGISYA